MRERRFMVGLLGALAGSVVAMACASSGGDGLMKRGAFAEAAASYDTELSARPEDADLQQKRARAREQAFRAKLEQARSIRGSGHGEAALSALDEALRLETRWALTPSAEATAMRDAEIAAARDTVMGAIAPLVAAKAPLSAEERARKLLPLLTHPRLAPVGRGLQAELDAAGRARCAELAGAQPEGAAHFSAWVGSYCRLLKAEPAAKPPASEQRRGLRISGKLAHSSAAQQRILEGWLAEVFMDSPWFAADAAEMTPLRLDGGYDAELERRRVVLSVPYREIIRSTVDLGPLRPTTTIETEAERVFQYEALQYDARYDVDVTLTLELGAGPPLVVRLKQADKKRDYEHDVTFSRADVRPRRPRLPDVNAWLTSQLAAKKRAMVRKLRGRWVAAYCAGSTFSADSAARCLLGRERRPAAVAALAKVFGPDTELLVQSVFRTNAGGNKTAGGGPDDKADKAPEIEEVPSAGTESI